MKTITSTFRMLAVIAGLLILSSCTLNKDSRSASMLIIESITGTTSSGTTANYLQSSVTSGQPDVATITVGVSLLNPSSSTGPSQYNSVTLTGYTVKYTLQDGTSVTGTVPASFLGTISSTQVTVGSTGTVTLIVVLASAKLVAPLSSLAGTTNTLPVIADITIQGQDLSGNPVQTTGQLSIIFGDYPVTTGS